LSLSQIACFLSHRLAWERVDHDYHIILEDDMDFNNLDLFLHIEQDLNNVAFCNSASVNNVDYDGVVMWKHPDKIPTDFKTITNHLVASYPQWGLCAYHIKPALATTLLSIDMFDRPIDNYIYDNVFKDNVCFTRHDPFVNLGFLGGCDNNYQFKSLIYG